MIAEKEKNGFKESLAYIFSRNPVLVLGLVIGQLGPTDVFQVFFNDTFVTGIVFAMVRFVQN